eukprot:6554751-Prymnesium_polylepis.1
MDMRDASARIGRAGAGRRQAQRRALRQLGPCSQSLFLWGGDKVDRVREGRLSQVRGGPRRSARVRAGLRGSARVRAGPRGSAGVHGDRRGSEG